MIRIYSDGEKISYTLGDSFLLTVNAADGFETDSKLKFQVAENEESDFVIDALYELEDEIFQITLTDTEKEKLSLGGYIYRIVLMDANGSVITRKSGELEVKWGA